MASCPALWPGRKSPVWSIIPFPATRLGRKPPRTFPRTFMKTHSSQIVGVGLIGFGTVGSGVAKLLHDEAARYERATGKRLVLRRVLVRDASKAKAAAQAAGTVSPDLVTT